MLRVMLETRGRGAGSFVKASGEPDALKGASPVRNTRVVGGSSPLAPALDLSDIQNREVFLSLNFLPICYEIPRGKFL
jgi:hypothetical protein